MREALKAGIVSVGRPGMGQFGVYGGTQRIPRVDQSVSRCRACACGVASLAGRPEQVIHIVCRPAVCCHGPDRGELVWEEVDDSSGRVVHTRSKIPRRQKSCGDGEHCLLGRTSRGRDERRNRVWKGTGIRPATHRSMGSARSARRPGLVFMVVFSRKGKPITHTSVHSEIAGAPIYRVRRTEWLRRVPREGSHAVPPALAGAEE